MSEMFDGGMDLRKLIFRIGEMTKITGVSARQLRYWDQKGYIESTRSDENASRVYSFFSLIKVVMIKQFLDQGYTLNAAINKMEQRKDEMRRLHSFFRSAYHGLKKVEGRTMIDLGDFDEKTKRRLYGYLDDNGKVKYKVVMQ